VTQNIYDDPGFFEGYSRLPRSVRGLDGAPEWPVLRVLLPGLGGRRMLDLLLGAGFALTRLVEWAPSPEQVAAEPDWAQERERPFFLLMACRRAD
jgi:hypothetical protein